MRNLLYSQFLFESVIIAPVNFYFEARNLVIEDVHFNFFLIANVWILRMPLFLPKALELQWLQPDLTDAALQAILDYEMPPEALAFCPVYSIRTTKPHPTNGLKTDPFDWPNLPPLGQDDGELQPTLF